MSEPIFGESTERVYARLPEHFRLTDTEIGWTMKRFLSGLLARHDDISALVGRFNYTSPEDGDGYRYSDLVDPSRADDEWLPWLAQLFGAKSLPTSGNVDLLYNAGSFSAIEATAANALAGTRYVRSIPQRDGDRAGTFWDITLITRNSETLKNLIPEEIAAATTSANIDCSMLVLQETGDPVWVKAKAWGNHLVAKPVTDEAWYRRTVLFLTNDDDTAISFRAKTPELALVSDPGDPHNIMVSVGTETEATIKIRVVYKNSTGATTVREYEEKNLGKVAYWFEGVSSADAVSFSIEVESPIPFKVGEWGARVEPDQGWIQKTSNPIQTVIDAGEKPAGFVLHHIIHNTTWDELEANLPTWTDWEAAGSWDNIEESDL